MCLDNFFFPDFWKVLSVFPVFRNVGEMSKAKKYDLVGLLSVFSKIFENVINIRLVDQLQKCDLLSDLQ